MYSVSSSFRVTTSQWRVSYKKLRFWLLPHSKIKLSFVLKPISSSSSSPPSSSDDNSASSKKPLLGYDPSEELLGLAADFEPREVASDASQRSWFGPNGLYIRELPCPSCRGRGYTPCAECDIERSRSDCSLCNGKGIVTCSKCSGDCVVWEESIDERPWERARLISPLKVKEDDEVDNLEIKLETRKKKKRVNRTPTAEVNLKISKALKILNAKTGIISKRMKIIHKDPEIEARRNAAIKRTKRTDAARKRASETMKRYFSDPENRRKRSIAMKGVKYRCGNCGAEGHKRFNCPLPLVTERTRKCRVCGEKGHDRRTCPKSTSIGPRKCRGCGETGHDRRNCLKSTPNLRKPLRCRVCGVIGHNQRTCPKTTTYRPRKCRLCGGKGHDRRTCWDRDSDVEKSASLFRIGGQSEHMAEVKSDC